MSPPVDKKSKHASHNNNNSKFNTHDEASRPEQPCATWWSTFTTFFSFGMFHVFGLVRDFFGSIFKAQKYRPREGYAPLVQDFEDFYTRRMYHRIQDCWGRPISSCPGAWIDVMERTSNDNNKTLTLTGNTIKALNLGSYNYLGFGDPNSPTKPHVFSALEQYGVSTCSSRDAVGNTAIHMLLEQEIARYVGKPAAVVFGMGFATNSTGIPALSGAGDLIISDALNHSSIVTGARASGAKVKVFNHNDTASLEKVIRRSIVEGQPRTHRPWNRILIVVEGIYSMEGETCPLAEIVRIKKKYNCYLYVDEAHSIGALGNTGRGICEHTGVAPADVDVLMGTFTKSFGSVGGYLASTQKVISYLKKASAAILFSPGISPPAAQQIISAIAIMTGKDGTDLGKQKLSQLHENANMFRRRLINMGFHVLGDVDSPIIPMLLYNPSKLTAFSRECLSKGVAVVVVGFPATSLLAGRARICISAAHTRKDLEEALRLFEEVGDFASVKYGKRFVG